MKQVILIFAIMISSVSFAQASKPATSSVCRVTLETITWTGLHLHVGQCTDASDSIEIPSQAWFNETNIVKYWVDKGYELKAALPPSTKQYDKYIVRYDFWFVKK